MAPENDEKLKRLLKELIALIKSTPDPDILNTWEEFQSFLLSILDPRDVTNYENYGEYFLDNKNRNWIIAMFYDFIFNNYAIEACTNGETSFLSPFHHQFYDDKVMLLGGQKPWAGVVFAYGREGVYRILPLRDLRGEKVGPDDFEIITEEEFEKRKSNIPVSQLTDIEQPIKELEALISAKDTDESHYQEFFVRYPWLLSLQHTHIQDHRPLDDRNIPDFTGTRADGRGRDIFEIKQPFKTLFNQDGEFSADFLRDHDQAERYLTYATRNADTLRREKGFIFDNPRAYLITGYGLDEDELRKINRKWASNTSIEVWTYNNILAVARRTIEMVENLPPPAMD